jgi:MOSC domain-containing protein YiiM
VGRGLEGDRYLDGSGHWSSTPGVGRQVTLIEIETIEALEREKNIVIAPGASRRNLVTRGVPLNHLVGREFQVGAVRLFGRRLCYLRSTSLATRNSATIFQSLFLRLGA